MSHDADVLQRLIANLRSASTAYRRAGADGPGLSDAFGAAAGSHDRTAESLAELTQAILGESAAAAEADGPAWAGLPRAVAQGPHAVVEAVHALEAELLKAFQTAIDDEGVSGPVREGVARASDGMKAVRERVLQRLDAVGA